MTISGNSETCACTTPAACLKGILGLASIWGSNYMIAVAILVVTFDTIPLHWKKFFCHLALKTVRSLCSPQVQSLRELWFCIMIDVDLMTRFTLWHRKLDWSPPAGGDGAL